MVAVPVATSRVPSAPVAADRGSSASAVGPTAVVNQTAFTESLELNQDVEEVKQRLLKEKKDLKKAIYVWTKDFVAANQREPTKEEREGDAKDMFKRYRTVSDVCACCVSENMDLVVFFVL